MTAARRTPDAGTIARRALAVLDEVGHAGFSMRRLGADLGVDPMAVYRRFADQEALFDGVAAALFDEVDVAALPWAGSWREILEGFCRRLGDVLLGYPPAGGVYTTRAGRSPAPAGGAGLRDAAGAPPRRGRLRHPGPAAHGRGRDPGADGAADEPVPDRVRRRARDGAQRHRRRRDPQRPARARLRAVHGARRGGRRGGPRRALRARAGRAARRVRAGDPVTAVETAQVDVPGAQLHVERAGAGPALLLIAGGGGDA